MITISDSFQSSTEDGGRQQVVCTQTDMENREPVVITNLPSSVGTVEARVDEYKRQVGLSATGQLGTQKWVHACEAVAQQGAVTFNSGITKTSTYQHDVPGYQILECNLQVLENKHNRGSYSSSIIAKDGQFTVNEQEIGDKWKVAIDLSIKAGDLEATRKLELDYQKNHQLIRNYASNKNTVFLAVTANGGLMRKSIIRVVAKALLVCIY